MADKIVNQLPVVLQTTAIKNFFENTVEQLYSQANTVPLKGFIGKKTGADAGLQDGFIFENTPDRSAYNLSPVVNNTNSLTGDSENLIFYDEFIDILETYGVTTRNHNTIFGSRYRVFMPPINVDKFVNYQEYYWSPTGPSAITIASTESAPINIDIDVLGKQTFTYQNTTLRNGMVIIFSDTGYTIPANCVSSAVYKAGVEYIVGGVGESIYLVEKNTTSSTAYGSSTADSKDYILIERGSAISTAWSRVNHWHHRNNFKDAGDDLPNRAYRANRPIIEFNRHLEMYNHGTSVYGIATVNAASYTLSEIIGQSEFTVDSHELEDNDIIFFPNESSTNKFYLYKVEGVGTAITLTATTSEAIGTGSTISIANGNTFKGLDYFYNGSLFVEAQRKISVNQAPLFVLYDDSGNRLDNTGLYYNSNFAGNKIFGYKVGIGANDTELGIPLSYTPYKSVSEITFENYIQSDRVNYQTYGSSTQSTVLGSYYYKLLKSDPEYHSYWKLSSERNEQKINTTHYITQYEVDDNKLIYNIGATPNVLSSTPSGYNIIVRVNNAIVSNYVYQSPDTIKFNSFTFKAGDVIDVEVESSEGIVKIVDSRYSLPLSWRANPNNQEIEFIAEPDYLSHFKRYIERQDGFVGDPLASNNFDSTSKDVVHAKDIVQTDHDLILSAFLLDDQPHNLVDAIRFSGREYEKYKARLIKEIDLYYQSFDTENLTNEYILEKVLRNLISYSIGKGVFNSTYILPFGDNYTEQLFDVADTVTTVYTLSAYNDISKIENTVLVYRRFGGGSNQVLLTLDEDYTFTSTNPITIEVSASLDLGDTIITKLYNKDRDSVECPATPSTMGIYPLFVPRIEIDSSFKTPVSVIVGHDGSRTTLKGDIRDSILLDFEKRIYNSARKELRDTNSLPALSVFNVRSGAFRDTNFAPNEYADLLRNSFINWSNLNKTDYIINEFYDETDKWTWNYRGESTIPGHWRGWYEYYYDTVRPHTHPWEMLAFFEEPTWWEDQYGTDYSSLNTAMWTDIEAGIIRQGFRENVTGSKYLIDNPFRRTGLSNLLPVNSTGDLLAPGEITTTGSAVRTETWTNIRVSRTDVTDTIKDTTNITANNLPNGINVTYGSSEALRVLFDAFSPPTPGTYFDYDGTLSANITGSGFVEGFDGFTTPYVYVQNDLIKKTYQLYNYTFDNLSDSAIIVANATIMSNTAIGVTVTGTPIINTSSINSWNDEGDWYFNESYRNTEHEYGAYSITESEAGLEEWDDSTHSPIVGWAFDGLPIYGPYGYAEYAANGQISSNTITSIKSCFELKSGDRPNGPCGKYTGEFVQDYTLNLALEGTSGYTGSTGISNLAKHNMRYGVTPDSPTTPIYFYVATIDEDGNAMFPYTVGGTVSVSDNTYKGKFYAEPVNLTRNNLGTVTSLGELVAISSSLTVTSSLVSNNAGSTDYISRAWRFGDGAPVENAWKYSVGYPFAVAEALLLARPGRFATLFFDPVSITSPALDTNKTINIADRTPFDYRSSSHARVHGDIDNNGATIFNVGYTQFINSWLQYQKLNVTTDFVSKLRTINIKLGHRLAGFTDKDTLTVRTDQSSATSKTSSLIIPDENISVVVHSSPYKNRNFYSGVMVQKSPAGYKVRGYDKNFGYFNIIRRNKLGRTTLVEVGGNPVDYTPWEPGKSYSKDTIVSYRGSYYRAPAFVTSNESFISPLWTRLPGLPTEGSQRATLYLDNLPYVDRVEYETEFLTVQDLANFIVGLGAYQEQLGYSFGEYDDEINDIRNWNYAVKQLLFWVAGAWETNNTVELSPLATKLKFVSTTGMVAKINRIDKNQFSLVDQDGKAIQPTECEIIRDGTTIEIVPPAGQQIYGCMLFTKEIEHALVFDNVTNFNDTLFSPLLNQSQSRLRIKGKKTANWNGTFTSSGFIIQNDELRPNLDNMAQSLGRYHELGFVPVEKQLYEQARGLFGYQERDYLSELEIDDDDQFEFYKGMLQSKGTIPSLQQIAKSNAIIQGNMDVYDEWALKIADFGDLENDQSIEIKLERSDIIHDPQLITLAFPEDTTGVVSEIRVIDTKHLYYDIPTIEIAVPTEAPAVQATATAVLASNGTLGAFNITNAGSGYEQPVRIQVIAGSTYISNVNTAFNTPVATTQEYTLESDISSLNLSNLVITDNFSNVNVSLDVSSITSFANIVTLINSNADINSNIIASYTDSAIQVGNTVVTQYSLSIRGNDFTLTEDNNTLANLTLVAGRYQPLQRYAIAAVGNHPTTGTGATEEANINVAVTYNGVTTYANASAGDWVYDVGSRQQINFNIATSGAAPGSSDGSYVYYGNVNVPLSTTLDANNIVKTDGYKYNYLDVFVDGIKLVNYPFETSYTSTVSTLTIDVDTLPAGKLAAGANIYVVEHPTIDFESTYFGDVPGASLNIKVYTNDELAILTESKRIYTITEDDKNDDTIFIDIDDSTRFLKKPIGVRETNLWPTTSNVDYTGITDDRYIKLPNAGYVSSTNVGYQSFDVPSVTEMFDPSIVMHPQANDTVHIAISENKDWNVYQFKEAQANVAFIEQEEADATTYLYTDNSLFEYTDSNQIGNVDLGRYLDYHIVLKNTNANQKFVVWINEQVVDSQQVRISNISAASMTEAYVTSIGPAANAVLDITSFAPAVSGFSIASATAADANGVVQVVADIVQLADNDVVSFGSPLGNIISLHANGFYTVSNVDISTGTFTINDSLLTSDVDAANLILSYYGKTQVNSDDHGLSGGEMIKIVAGSYSGAYLVESAGANTFVIPTPYLSSGPTTGSILKPEITITTSADHGISNDYAGKQIVVSNAEPRYYNLVYNVDSASGNTINISGVFAYANVANTMTANTCVVSTLDHDVISLNNSSFKIDNINSVDGIVDSINRGMQLRRGWIQRVGSLSMNIPMQNSVLDPRTGMMSSQTSGFQPYGTPDYLMSLSTTGIKQVGAIKIDPAITQKVGFNTDPIRSGTVVPPRTTTSLSSGTATNNINTSPFVPRVFNAYQGPTFVGDPNYNTNNWYDAGIDTSSFIAVDMIGQTRLIDPTPIRTPPAPTPKPISIPLVVPVPPVAPPVPKPQVNNPKPQVAAKTTNNTGAVVINPVAVVAVPKQKVCGTSLPPPTPPVVPPKPVPITAPASPVVRADPPTPLPVATSMKCEFQQQSVNTRGVNDIWYYLIPASGTVKLICDNYSDADQIRCYQVTTRSSSGGRQLAGSDVPTTLRKATASEKFELNAAGNQSAPASYGPSTNYYNTNSPADYTIVGSGFKNCAVIEFNWDPKDGSYLRINVTKPSSVYRYKICYPSTAPGGVIANPKQNTNAGQPASLPPYGGGANVSSSYVVPVMSAIPQTPIIQPSAMPTTKNKVYVSNPGSGMYGASANFRFMTTSPNGYAHNFGGFSLAPMVGFGFIPSIFKRTVKTTSAENVGRLQQLDSSRYVNSKVQRVTGGYIIPLASPAAAPIPLTARGIRGLDFSNDPLFKTLGNIGNGKDIYIDYLPKRIASSNYDIQSFDIPRASGSGANGTGTIISVNPLVGSMPTTVLGTLSADSTSALGSTGRTGSPNAIGPTSFQENLLTPGTELPAEDAPVNVNDYEFSTAPVITLQPKKKLNNSDGTFNYVPAGPKAIVPIWSPTPSQTISEGDLIGARPGDELLINNKPIIIQSNPAATLKQIECAVGFGFTTSKTVKKGDPALKISSCTNAPITFKDGCRGGVYKEVLDFHIVKTFSLTDSETSNTAVLMSTGGWSKYNNGTGIYENYTPDSTYTLYNANGSVTGTQSLSSGDSSNTGKILSSRTEVAHTGGKGYQVGDRLRVVGGVPMSSPYGEVRAICINDGGQNYTSASNVRVFVGDGSTPGKGASVGSVQLDSNGSIISVTLGSVGRGYDIMRPPVIRVVDTGEASSNSVIIPARLTATIETKSVGIDGTERTTHGLPERPAKFVVTKVTDDGTIEALRIIDRGIYKEFPADLTTGLPLEYDAINLGDEHDGSIPPTNATGLGQYDPTTYAKLDSPGAYDPIRSKFTNYGTGARVFLTAREIPDCSERSDASSRIGLQPSTPELDIPSHLADLLNNGLLSAGYNPNDINFGIAPINDDLSSLVLDSPVYDGIEIGELTPGFLDKLGIPAGDYNGDMTGLAAVNATPLNDENGTPLSGAGTGLDGLSGSDTDYPTSGTSLPEEVIAIYGVHNNGFASDGSSILGNANVTYIGDMYQYELRTVDGDPVITPRGSKNVSVLYLESLRYKTETGLDLSSMANVWIDNYNNTGWAYLESNVIIEQQRPLVDPKYIKNTIIYDSTTGEKDHDFDMWDPFKGVLPAFVDAEITYFGETDPVSYNASRGMFGPTNIGQVWWNTSTIRYNWYEQGTNKQRWQNWGSAFPGSAITLYEWVESLNPPLQYTGTGLPKNGSEYIVERRKNKTTGDYTNYYYFWVQNVEVVSNQAAVNAGRKFSTQQLARYLADPIGQGINTVSFISSGNQDSTNVASFVMGNLSKTIREDEQNIQINLSRNLNPIGLKHTSWKLLRENDNNSIVPEDLITKMIDSLCEEDTSGNTIPASNLSSAERYGIKFRPRQTMFKNPAEARRAFQYLVNELLADIKVNTLYPGWDTLMPSSNYIETTNWYEKIRKDATTNSYIRYDSTYKAMFTVGSVKELDTLKNSSLPDGAVIMVRASASDRYHLYRWSGGTSKFSLIAIENETVKLKSTVYTDTNNATLKAELRAFIRILESTIFSNTPNFNLVFFEMVKHALGEQRQLDWAFKTSYIYVEKEEEDLVQRVGYNPDNFDPVVEYLNEVKPYTSKIREYKDGKRAPIEYISDQMVSDYDIPPYADADQGAIRILNFDSLTDRTIMSENTDYIKAYNSYDRSQTQWDTANVPIRLGQVNLIFDRIDWRLLEHDFNPATTSYIVSIANNIANINSASNTAVANTASNVYSASARIFKFDPEVRTQFNTDIDEYFGANSSSNTSIIESNSYLQSAITNGALSRTLYMVKQKVGGTWTGEELDANVFTQVVNYADALTLQSVFGYDTSPFDHDSGFGNQFDSSIEVENFEGIFSGNSTYRQEGVTYDGFDGWSFKHLLYGEERPEELVYLSPLENFIMHVRTDPTAYDANGDVVSTISVGPYQVDNVSTSVSNTVTITSLLAVPLLENNDTVRLADTGNTILANDFVISNVDTANSTFTIELAGVDSNVITNAGNITLFSGVAAVSTEYLLHNDLFGKSEYLRILTNGSGSTTTASKINAWDTEIEVVDASVLPIPRAGRPGAVWLDHSERVEYLRISGNKLLDVTRGTRGTTIPAGQGSYYDGNVSYLSNTTISHAPGVSVVAAGVDNVFNASTSIGGTIGYESRDPDNVSWLKPDGTTLGLCDITNRSNVVTIAAFLQGDTLISIGWDSRGWDTTAWDAI